MSDLPYDYDEEDLTQDTDLNTLMTLCRGLVVLVARKHELEAQTAIVESKIAILEERLIPATMDRLKMSSVGMQTGLKVTISDEIHAKLPKDSYRRKRALDAVRRSGNEALIKTAFEVTFGRNSAQHVERFRQLLRDNPEVSGHAQVSLGETIHHSTYAKFVRDLAATDDNVDLEELGAYRRRVAKID